MNRRSAVEEAARAERISAIRRCRHRDSFGWRLGLDGLPADVAVRCNHSPPPASGRDVSEPIHQPDLFDAEETRP